MNCKKLLHQISSGLLFLILINLFISPVTSAPQQKRATLLPEIGDEVMSKDSSLQVTVLKVEKADSVKDSFDVVIKPEDAHKALLITIKLRNLSHKGAPTFILGPNESTVQDIKKRLHPFKDMGIVKPNELPLFLPEGMISLGSFAKDASKERRLISVAIGSSIQLLLVYFVPIDSSQFILSMPGFDSISLQDLKPNLTSKSKPSHEIKLYPCQEDKLVEECEQLGGRKFFLYAPEANTQRFEYTLAGDIDGTSYGFNLMLASKGMTTFKAEVLLRQNKKEALLAATSFTVTSASFQQFSNTVAGQDPTTTKEDVLIFRISAVSGADGAFVDANSNGSTFITIPSIK